MRSAMRPQGSVGNSATAYGRRRGGRIRLRNPAPAWVATPAGAGSVIALEFYAAAPWPLPGSLPELRSA